MNKVFTSLLLASTTGLAACGGGGGGGGGVAISTPVLTNIGNLDALDTIASDSFIAVLADVSSDGIATASEIKRVFEWVETNENLDSNALANYTIQVDGTNMSLQSAWYKLLGYKKAYWDGKETYWNNIIDTGKVDNESDFFKEIKTYAENENSIDFESIGKGEKTIEEVKNELPPAVYEISRVTENREHVDVTTDDKVTTSVAQTDETVNGYYYVYNTTTTVTVTTTTTKTTTTPILTITYSNGSTKSFPLESSTITTSTDETTTVVGDPVLVSKTAVIVSQEDGEIVSSESEVTKTTVTYDIKDNEVLTILESGTKKYDTIRTTETTTAVTTTTTTTTQPIITYTYGDDTVRVENNGDPIITEESAVETTVESVDEIVDTRYEYVETNREESFEITETTETEVSVSEPVVTTTYVDKEDEGVVQDNGDTLYTTTRTYTDTTTIQTNTTVTTTQSNVRVLTITYSNGTQEITRDTPVVTVTPVTTSEDNVTTSTRTIVLSTRIVEAAIIETGRTTENTVTTTKEVDEKITPVTVTTYIDEEDAGVVQDNGDILYTTTRTYTDTTTTTTVTTTTTTTNTTPVTTVTYSDNTTETIVGETVVTTDSTSLSESVITITTRSEIIDTRIVENTVVDTPDDEVVEDPVDEVVEDPVDEVVEDPVDEVVDAEVVVTSTTTEWLNNMYYSHLVREYLDPVVTTEDAVSYSGTWKITTRNTTTCIDQIHHHYDARDQRTTVTYSNGTTDITDEKILYPRTPQYKPANFKNGWCKVVSEEVSRVNTDNGEYGEDSEDMGTRTPNYVSDPGHYETNEYSYLGTDQLSSSNFSSAYSRGWTGKGSTIVIADTGALTTHTDLDANITATVDYTNTTMDTGADHGTHVAGIAGAERNSDGMHGAAFDANLAIAKVSSGTFYSFANAIKAAEWGKNLGSVAINVSAEVNYDRAFRNSIVKTAPGEYYSTHWYYGENGYNGAVDEAVKWKSALGDEQVLVKAAGNAGWDYSAGMNQMATATDANGNLILDGQMIVVGNWDQNNNKLNSSSNKAGTVCATIQNGVCIDSAKIKDFYIMANGTQVTSTGVNGDYVTMTGTSMAAPVVTGSIAILHQMWPHMKGKHLVQLVLVTGNKNIAGYDENVHGQGLLDMDRATRPVGATGIPTSGRTNGGVSSVAGGANVSGVAASQITALTNVMVLDSFERDFYIDLSGMVGTDIDTRTASVAEQMGAVNYFAGYLNSNQQASYTIGKFTVGAGKSDGHYLGNQLSGTLGTTESSFTIYTNYDIAKNGFYAQLGAGITKLDIDVSNSLLDSAEPVVSSTWTLGYENNNWGIAVSQPVTVESAKMKYNIPTTRTPDGNVVTEMRTIDWKNSNREIDLGTYYNFKLINDTVDVKLFGEIRTKVASIANEIEKRAGITFDVKF